MKLVRDSSLKKLRRAIERKEVPPERQNVIENAMASAYRRRQEVVVDVSTPIWTHGASYRTSRPNHHARPRSAISSGSSWTRKGSAWPSGRSVAETGHHVALVG